MLQSEILLSVGENIQVGNQVVTIVDIEGDEIIFRVDNLKHRNQNQSETESNSPLPRNPR